MDHLGRQAQNQVLAGLARVKTTVALNVTGMLAKFEVDRRADSWGRWATSQGLEAIRTHLNQTRDELDHAARRISGYEKQLGGVDRPMVPARALVKVGDLDRAKMDQEALQASRATTQKLDLELQGAKAQVLSLEAQLKACRAELKTARSRSAATKVAREAGSRKGKLVTAEGTSAEPSAAAASEVTLTVTPSLDPPTMADVFRGVDPQSGEAMVAGETSSGVVAARLAVLQLWKCLGKFQSK
jgi:chloramphenicol 3-O-phosphotransferase